MYMVCAPDYLQFIVLSVVVHRIRLEALKLDPPSALPSPAKLIGLRGICIGGIFCRAVSLARKRLSE